MTLALKLVTHTLVDLLAARSEAQPDALAFRFLNLDSGSGGIEEWSYAHADELARAIAVDLRAHASVGDRAVLLYPPGLEFVAAFLGCLYAGVIAVPAYPPNPSRADRSIGRLRHIFKDCEPVLVLTTDLLLEHREAICAAAPEFGSVRWIATASVDRGAAGLWKRPAISGESIAFLQYTSGSTGNPKGAINRHANVLSNEQAITEGFRTDSDVHVVGWLPLFHDMGLIGNLLHPLYMGGSCTLMSPAAFLKRPLNWLAAISRYRGTVSGGPNFAYDLCVSRVSPEERATLDLSSWAAAYNGSEPVRKETMDRFADAFASCGFRKHSFLPCYGLAEATLYVTSSGPGGYRSKRFRSDALTQNRAEELPETEAGSSLVSSGLPPAGHAVSIADPATGAECPDGTIGEILFQGPSLAGGYWNNSEQTSRTFPLLPGAQGPVRFLRTGDLGFLSNGELFITGRLKDLIILRGRNLYPQDIEVTAGGSHPAVRSIAVAAFSIEVDGQERLAVLAETSLREAGPEAQAVFDAIRGAVAQEHQALAHTIILTAPNRIPRTSSGKIQRHACRAGWLKGSLPIVAASVSTGPEAAAVIDGESGATLDLAAVVSDGRLAAVSKLIVRELTAVREGADPIPADASLAELGLDSLMVLEFQARLERAVDVSLSAAVLAEAPDLNSLAESLLQAWENREAAGIRQLVAGPRTGVAPASSGQIRLFLLNKLADAAPVYHIHFGVGIDGAIDPAIMQQAFHELGRRHAVLRTTIRERDGIPYQQIDTDPRNEFGFLDISGTPADDRDALIARLAIEQANRPFRLESGPLTRALLLRCAPDHQVLLLTQHHIITDGWSARRLLTDLAGIYDSLTNRAPLRAAPYVEFGDFARWEVEHAERGGEGRSFWTRQVSGLQRLDLPVDDPATARSYRGGRVRFEVQPSARERLFQIAREENCTLFTALLAVYALLLQRYSGQSDIPIGSVVANRRPEFHEVCGFFANTVAIRCDLSGKPTFRELLRRTGPAVRETMRFSSFPFAQIARLAGGHRGGDENPVFQANFVFESGVKRNLKMANSTWSPLFWAPDGSVEGTAKFDLSLAMVETDQGISAAFEYADDRLREDVVRRMTSSFLMLLDDAIARPDVRTVDLFFLPDGDRRLLATWNNKKTEVARECFHRLFERQAESLPNQVAVADARYRMTYGELNCGANRIARRLRLGGVSTDALIALLMPRTSSLLAAILGVFKAGAAYVPIDPNHPEARQVQIVKQSGAAWIVTTRDLEADIGSKVFDDSARILFIEDLLAEGVSGENIPTHASPTNLAYVIYTSGSTGLPKGAMIEHAGMLNHLHAKISDLGLRQSDVIAQTASQCFDISVWQYLAALLVGARVQVFDTETAGDMARLYQGVAQAGVTVLEVVPSVLLSGFEELERRGDVNFGIGSLRWLLLTGEALSPQLVRRWFAGHAVPIVNAYGPTECSDDVTHHVIRNDADIDGPLIPIGRPVINTRLHVLDDADRPVPIGVAGELHVGGIGVGRGYQHDAARTAAVFVPDPFSNVPGARLYCTGDRVRMLADGTLVFLGRGDNQVKIRGFRIELGEVEAALEEGHDVVSAVAAAHEIAGELRLVAYIQWCGQPSVATLRSYLKDRLPDYMVPSIFVDVAAMPLTPNGKIDRRALPKPDLSGLAWEGGYVAPRNPIEELVAEIWAEVLGVERIGIEDNFFERGGHSLLATQAMSRLRSRLGVEIALRKLFEAPTAAGLAREIERARGGGNEAAVAIPRRRQSGDLPLSFAQQRLWFLEQLAPGEATYNVPGAVRIAGALEVDALRQALQEIVRRHESLRTTFAAPGGEACQRIGPAADLEMPLIEVESESAVADWLGSEAGRPFDLSRGPLLRAALLRLSDQEHVLAVSMHHIVSDGWSLGVLMREASVLYAAYEAGGVSPLPELEIQYADYSVWQRDWLQGAVLEQQMAYWRQELGDVATVLDLPVDRARAAQQSQRGAQHAVRLEPELVKPLRLLGRQQGATLYMVLLAGFQALLSRYTGQQQVLVGSPIAGRTRREIESLIGFFVNTLVLRGDLRGSPDFAELLARVRETTLGAFAHQDVPFEKLVEVLSPERDPSRSPLFQVMFILQNAPAGDLKLGSAQLQPLAVDTGTAKFEITLALEEHADGSIGGYWEYNRDLFDAASIARMAGHYQRLLQAALADPKRPVAELDILTAQERHRVLVEWNDTAAPFPDQCLHHLFEQQAEKTPDAVALLFADASVSYRQLDRQANRIARALIKRGEGAGSYVGLCMDRSPAMVAAILGILKSGAAYVPLDPAYPAERLLYMQQSARLKVVLADAVSQGCFATEAEWLDVSSSIVDSQSGEPIGQCGNPGWAAYAVFTSGSTGIPKGTVGLHRGAVNRCSWMWRSYAFASGERSAMKTSTNFVDSIWEIFGPLLRGIPSVILSNDQGRDTRRLVDVLAAANVTRIVLVPSLLRAMLESEPNLGERLSRLVYWTSSGEALSQDLIRAFRERLPGRILLNLYGCSEASGDSTAEDNLETVSSIGRPIDNTQIYILDSRLQPVFPGMAGEIYIGGSGLAEGYLWQPDETAQRFLPNPFSNVPGSRLCRTLDMGRHLADGTVEYVGRADRQVKVRGMRADLREIELALVAHPAVSQAVAMQIADRIVAYIAPRTGASPPDGRTLRSYLKDRLPDYMVPSIFVDVAAMPLTPNGKIDRRALPKPDLSGLAWEGGYVAPRNPIEELVAEIWAEVLGVERIGIEDNFFERGGHSLLATQAMSRLRSRLGVEIALRKLFEAPTAAGLAREIERARGGGNEAAVAIPRRRQSGDLPLSFAQQRLWFLEQLAPGEATYNVPGAVRIAGALEVDALRQALQEIVRRHESLRTTFAAPGGEACQRIGPAADLEMPLIEVESESAVADWLGSEAGRPFDLSRGPLLRAALLRLSDQEHVLAVSMHHIVSDGWSLGVLMREASVLYAAYEAGGVSPLPELEIQYADYSVWQRDWLQGAVLEQQMAYWRQELGDVATVLDLPVDRARAAQQSQRGAQHAVRLEPELVKPLRLLGRQQGATLYMVLLAGFQALLSRYTGQQQVLVGSPIAGRTRREIESLIGFFVNTLVLRGDLRGSPDFAELLARVRETTLGAFAHQDVPFEKLVEVLSPERDPSRSPLFQVMFILQNAPAGDLKLGSAQLQPLAVDTGTAKFEITLALEEHADGSIGGYWEYNRDLFDAASIARMAGHYQRLLQAALADPKRPVAELDILTAQERHRVLVEWNDTAAPFPDQCLHHLFEQQAEKTPDAVALLFADASVSYRQLDRQANRIARALIKRGVQIGDRIGVLMQRSPELVAVLLAILKAGAAYVPLDPDYPDKRIASMLEDVDAALVVTSKDFKSRFAPETCVLTWDDLSATRASGRRPQVRVRPDALFYVLHTSGSTGRPKGVMVQHRGIVNCLHWMQEHYRLDSTDRFLFKTSLNFDPSVWEVFWPLVTGGAVVIAPQNAGTDPEMLRDLIVGRKVTGVYFVPSMLDAFLQVRDLTGTQCLHHVICGGEKLSAKIIQAFYARFNVALHHSYGPTETSIAAAEWTCIPGQSHVSFGRPLSNVRLYVLHRESGEPVAVGVAGELHIGGSGVGIGYAGRPDLTAERFVPDRFSTQRGSRLYQTGDLVRYLPDGELEFLGRLDDQVKIRGYRIELGEVESVLEQHDCVERAIVVAARRPNGEPYLAAYVLSQKPVTGGVLRKAAQLKLPEYMIPAVIIEIEKVPLTVNGKIDFKALPPPESADRPAYTPPSTDIERQLVSIWCELFDVERIGIDDDFFESGGHSLLATRMLARANDALGSNLTVRQIFELRTIAQLARAVEAGGDAPAAPRITRAVRRPVRAEAMAGLAQDELVRGSRDGT